MSAIVGQAGPTGAVSARLERRVLRASPHLMLTAAGVMWGLATGFAFWFPDAIAAQAGGLLLALLAVALVDPRHTAGSCIVAAGLLMLAHTGAAFASGTLGGSSLAETARYLALAPAFVVLLTTVLRGPRSTHSMRLGLTLGGLVFVVYHLLLVDLAQLDRPRYRVTEYLNPNGVGFIAAVVGLSLLDYAFALRGRRLQRTLAAAGFAACVLLCFATKSRTAMLAFIAGATACVALRMGLRRTLPWAAVLAVAAVLAPVAWYGGAAEAVDYTLSLSDPHRNVRSVSQRADIWRSVVNGVWLTAPILGRGPGSIPRLVGRDPHSGTLRNLGETGLLGTIPLMMLLALAAWHAWRLRRNRLVYFAVPLVVCGVVESGAESMFFSMGNPGSLLFMLGVAALAAPTQTWRRAVLSARRRRRRRDARRRLATDRTEAREPSRTLS